MAFTVCTVLIGNFGTLVSCKNGNRNAAPYAGRHCFCYLPKLGFLLYHQFYKELVFRAVLSFTYMFKNLSFSLFGTKKLYFKGEIAIFFTFIIINFLVRQKKAQNL